MPERTTSVHRWPEGVLRTGRAAAFLTLAAGVNGTLAALVHGWEPRWLYVAAVGVIAALDGWLIGIAAAVGAVICYQLMSFGGLNLAPDRDGLLLGAAIVVAIAARTMRVSIGRPRLAAPKAPPLLTGITAVAVDLPSDPDAAAAVHKATEGLRRALDEERARAERERAMRRELEERSRRETEEIADELQRSKSSLQDLLNQHDDLQRRHAALRSDFEQAETAARATAGRVADYERSHEQLRSIVRDAEALRDAADSRASELERSVDESRASLGRTQVLQQASENRAAELERANVHLQTLVDELTSARNVATTRAENAEWSGDQLLARIAETEAARESAARRATDLDDAVAELRASSASARQQAEERVAALEGEIARLSAEHTQQRFQLGAEWNEKLARNAFELTNQFNVALLESDARANAASAAAQQHAARVDELEREVAAVLASAGELRASIDAGWQQKLARNSAELTDRFNAALLESDARTGAARAEALQRAERIEELEREIAAAPLSAGEPRASIDAEWQEKLQARIADVTNHYNQAVIDAEQRSGSAVAEAKRLAVRVAELEREQERLRGGSERVATLENELRSTAARMAELEADAEMLRRLADQQRSRVEAQWSEKFARSAMDITQHFQGELSEAKVRAGEAEAEARRLTAHALELEQEMSEIHLSFNAEKASLEAEWNQKLQTIVAHLASDHEADLGQATLEREEARAEARGLAAKLSLIDLSVREMSKGYKELQARNEELQARNESLRLEADEQRREAGAQRKRADNRDAEWNAKIAASALELTQRFNGAMAAADSRLQEANREAESLASRVRELEQIIAGLRSSDEERRAAIDAEWNSKLQTIVNHLASDHESDIGQAMLEKEAARAEARMLTSRLSTLQATLESERQAQGKSNTEWMAERAQLIDTIDSIRRRLGTSSGTIPLPAPPESARPSVIVVHRDPAVRAIVRHALESSGYDVTAAADGLEAFRMAMSWKPSVVLAEVQMAKMDGRELVQMLKSRPETAAVKIVLMSSGENGERQAGDFQADDFVRDPANVETLKATLANVLGVRA